MIAADRRPSILYVITDLLTGGVPLHLYRLCRAMRGRGFDPIVFALSPPGPVSRMLQDDGFAVHHGLARGPLDLRALWRLASTVRRCRPDLIHSFLFHANIAARWVRAALRMPIERLICEIQTVEIERPWHLLIDGLTQEMCRCEVGNSPSVIEHLIQRAHFQRGRLLLVRGGIDPEVIDAAPYYPRRHWNLPDSVPLLVWTGRLDPVKGLDDLLAAMSHLAARSSAHLALAGEGEYRGHVERTLITRKLVDRVTLLGRREDVGSLLKAADLFVFPSYTEGLPNALLEAIAARLPVVTTNVPGCRDLIRHEVNGLLVPPRDPKQLAEAIERMLSDPALARRLAEAARQSVLDHWTISATYDAYETMYRSAIGSVKR